MRDGDFRVRGKEISRVEGLSDAVSGVAINFSLLFVILFFIYPLKFVFGAIVDRLLMPAGYLDR